ncbi:YcaO-like family protein [Thalassomonas sp. RHCl1]|uniref:YcaO-like family protein n=1 Tax=Thalassomonas sp. RHCl1 TaxID=2995320 RepID=UPI00248C2E82|nr:YcaO-like family protein [Thalassomonas sp. RHCl1]
MNSLNLTWHPKFSFYCFKNIGVLLVNENSFLWLPEHIFPAITLIDGKTTIGDITNSLSTKASTDATKIATFIYQVNQLKQQGVLLDSNSSVTEQYQTPQLSQLLSLYHDDNIEIVSISSAPKRLLSQWSDILDSTLKKANISEKTEPLVKKLTFLLVDDLLDGRIEKIINNYKNYCVIKITGETLTITPVFEKSPSEPVPGQATKSAWQQLQHTLYRNQPVRQFLARLYPGQAHIIPFKKRDALLTEHLVIIEELLLRQLTTQSKHLLRYEINSHKTSQHLLHFVNISPDKSNAQFTQKVVLHHVKSAFNKDGGSRTIAPTATVKKLLPFVDEITGYLPVIEELSPESDAEIKIYRSAFFKTPRIKDLVNLNSNAFVQTSLGKGVSHEQSQASALCEAIERLNAQFQGDEPLYLAQPDELSQRYVSFQQLSPYSEAQYSKFADQNDAESQRKQAVMIYNNQDIYWLPTWSLTHQEPVYVPLSCCFANIELKQQTAHQQASSLSFNDDKFGRWHSNGAAAGNTLEEAILQALFELIERDAAAIWWYNQIERPAFDLTKIDKEFYQPLERTLSKHHHFWVLELTNDLGIPVMVAVGQHKENNGLILGFGCHLQAELAAQRALTELCQLIPIRDQKNAPFDFDAIVPGAYLYPNEHLIAQAPFTSGSGDIKDDILAIVEHLKHFNLETLVLDYSRAPIPMHTAKVFVPGLCHIWPQLANERLYQVPVQLNWLTTAKNEKNINQQGLYI